MKKLANVCLAALLLVALAVPAWADLGTGLRAIRNGDYATALKELLPLAEQGNAVAQYQLGKMYRAGQGVAKDRDKGMFWFRKSAEQGYMLAQNNLGLSYYIGEDVPKSYEKAFFWFRKSAEQGFRPAQFMLGWMYAAGQSVPKDYVQAYMWLDLSASSGRKIAVEKRYRLSQLMTPAQIAEARRLSREWRPKKPAK